MTTPGSSLRSVVRVATLAAAASIAAACGTSTSPENTIQKVKSGDVCSVDGAQAGALDGCNTCSCRNGEWSCTQKACPVEDAGPRACKVGDVMGSGCGHCWCNGGYWACTATPCSCTDGEVKQQDCNTCSCSGGQWECTTRACPPFACNDGERMGSGCTACLCNTGHWQCAVCAVDAGAAVDSGAPARGCGGRLGDTCASNEYCAYAADQLCGAADVSATCQPRPQGCTLNYDPVCGCDGKTYGNGCTAAMSGTGIQHAGACN